MTRKNRVDLEDVEATIQAMADATRLRILALLADGEVCVCRIHESLRLPQSKVSRHLAYLRRSGLVRARKEGLWVHYSLARREERLDALIASVQHCLGEVRTIQRDRRKLAATTGVAASTCVENTAARCSAKEAALPEAV